MSVVRCIQNYLCLIAFLAVSIVTTQESHALIRGDKGNKPISDPGWPKGAEPIFNTSHRIAWWEGPPFGGGQWHAECQGNTDALNIALKDFANIDSLKKRVIVHDGVASSFWLDPNREQQGASAIEVDWIFVIWQDDRWKMQRNLPISISALKKVSDSEPIPEITIYTGGAIRWKDVVMPEGIEVVDHRLESHGYTVNDLHVLEGNLHKMSSADPIPANVRVEKVSAKPEGGYAYESLMETKCDAKGHWEFRKIPNEWCRIVADAEGYCPRLLGYFQFSKQPSWQKVDSSLAKTATVGGRVLDDKDKPLAEVDIRLWDMAGEDGQYETVDAKPCKSIADGTFELQCFEGAKGSIQAHREGYIRPGLGTPITAPAKDIVLKMDRSGSILVRVKFPVNRKKGDYMIHIEPVGGSKVGSWGGSGNINEENELQFKDVPAGEYELFGRPNPGSDSEKTETVYVTLTPGKASVIEVEAK